MNSAQNDAIVAALIQAVRAGFSVTFEPAETGGYAVTIRPKVIHVGKATDRIAPFTIVRADLCDAVGNSLNVTQLEIVADESAARHAVPGSA